jgi:hypothetical protein
MVFNLNIVDLTIIIILWNNNTLYKIFFIGPLNYLHFHHLWNTSDKDYSFFWFFKHETT